MSEDTKTVVIVLSETRGHELTFSSFKKNVIDVLNADLCLCIGVKKEYDYDNPYYKLAKSYSDQGELTKASEAFDQGDQFFKRVQLHANPDYSLSEQMDRESGYMVGARDLTWSYASVLKADQARTSALKKIVK